MRQSHHFSLSAPVRTEQEGTLRNPCEGNRMKGASKTKNVCLTCGVNLTDQNTSGYCKKHQAYRAAGKFVKSTRPCFGKHNAKEILSCELCSENKECYAAYVEMIKSDWYCYDCKKTATKECFHGHCVMPKYYAKAQGIIVESITSNEAKHP